MSAAARRGRLPAWAPPVLWACVILALTSWPNPNLEALDAVEFDGADKLVHALLYAVLGFLAARAWLPRRGARRAAATIGAAIALFGAADEWHQQFIPGRSMDKFDWLADTVGAMCGVAAGSATLRRERVT